MPALRGWALLALLPTAWACLLSAYTPGQNLVVTSPCSLGGAYVFNNVTITAKITVSSASGGFLNITANSVFVTASGSIDATGAGFGSGLGPGSQPAAGTLAVRMRGAAPRRLQPARSLASAGRMAR